MPSQHKAPPRKVPTDDHGYFEIITKAVFQTGIKWAVVENKWPGFREVFHDFDIKKVSAFTEDDLYRLVEDTRIIRHGGKIKATIANATTCVALVKEHGSMKGYLKGLRSLDFSERVMTVRKQFRFLGPLGVYVFLYSVGEPVPDHEDAMSVLKTLK